MNGDAKDSYTVLERIADQEPEVPAAASKVLPGNTDFIVNDLTLRMDYKTPDHSNATLKINADGTLTIKGNRGDLFWLPNVEVASNSVIKTVVTMDVASDPTKASAGTVFNIQADGAWDNNADTAMIAALRPYNGNSRRTLGAINYESATVSAGYISGGELSEVNYTPTNASFGNTWALGATVKTTISQDAETDEVKAIFTDANDEFIIDAKYTNAQYPFAGPVGYMTHWSNSSDYYEYTINEFKITNAIVNGVKVAEFDLIAELAAYMSEQAVYTLRSSLSLNGVIGFNVRVDANYFITGTETLVVTDQESATVVETTLADIWNAENGYYVCTIPVNAKEMTDTFTVTLKNGDDVIATYSNLSVKSYAEALKADEDWKDLMTAMLNYGAAAQVALDYKTNDLAADISGGITFDFTGYQEFTYDGDTDILDGLYMNLVLESDTAFNIYFKPATGVELTVTVNGDAAELTENGDGYYVLTVGNIAADELLTDFAIVVNDELSFAVNALDWAKIASAGTDADLATLANALAAYAYAAATKN